MIIIAAELVVVIDALLFVVFVEIVTKPVVVFVPGEGVILIVNG